MDRAAFALFAKLEERHWWFRGRRAVYLPLLEAVLAADGARIGALDVADVGCGVGGFLGPLARLGRVLGVELDEPALAWAAGRGRRNLLVGRSHALPLPDAGLDLVTLFDVLEHTDEEPVLAEARRVLRPGGHLAISVPAYQFLYAHNDRVAHHRRRYTRGRLVRRLREAGLELRRATYVNVTLAPLIVPAVLLLKLKERLLGVPDDDANNLTIALPGWLNEALAAIFASERRWLSAVSAPFGHSILALARRPTQAP